MGTTRVLHRLTALGIARLKTPGMHADGGGLYLQVRSPTSKSWIFRYRFEGRERELGLGSLLTVSLAEARERAATARKQKSEGIDPVGVKREQTAARRAEERKLSIPTFDEAVAAYLRTRSVVWKNAKHAQQWTNTLTTYASPHFGKWPVSEVDFQAIRKALEPIWFTKTETASRVRGRIEEVLDWARVMGFRSGENPARWRGNLDKVFPARGKVAKVKHHPALPYSDMPEFMVLLRKEEGIAAVALRFAILTGARSSEVQKARWSEIDFDQAVWTVPAPTMKGDREHRVPLSPEALTIVKSLPRPSDSAVVFPNPRSGRRLSENALLAVLDRVGRGDVTVHGFRSSFRDWAAEETDTPNEVLEMALAHVVKNPVEAAYRRGQLFAKRKVVMDLWAAYLASPSTHTLKAS